VPWWLDPRCPLWLYCIAKWVVYKRIGVNRERMRPFFWYLHCRREARATRQIRALGVDYNVDRGHRHQGRECGPFHRLIDWSP
jgi:hypothetical protein